MENPSALALDLRPGDFVRLRMPNGELQWAEVEDVTEVGFDAVLFQPFEDSRLITFVAEHVVDMRRGKDMYDEP